MPSRTSRGLSHTLLARIGSPVAMASQMAFAPPPETMDGSTHRETGAFGKCPHNGRKNKLVQTLSPSVHADIPNDYTVFRSLRSPTQ